MATDSSTNGTSSTRLAPVISISHGGGPMPLLGDPSQASIVSSLKNTVPKILKLGTPEQPRAIVLVTAHWSERVTTISSADKHALYYDYSGFPPETYKLKYNAPGDPEVAEMVYQSLKEEGVEARKDSKRGWDHGVFVPMMLIHPSASIPIVQLSVLSSESPSAHYAVGRALARLRARNIAVIGSGFASMHNIRHLFSGTTKTPEYRDLNKSWNAKMTETVQTEDAGERGKMFESWRKWPGAFDMHPRGGAEHFLPLVVCAGAGGNSPAKSFVDEMWGLDIWSYYWE